MKRDPRLQGLSSDHHRGLVIARRLARGPAQGEAGAELAGWARRALDAELEPHFRTEEEVLLPALSAAGAGALAGRTLREHAEMRELVRAAEAGEPARLLRLAELLGAHIRFEERELFPAAEERLPAEVLDAVARRAPHPARGGGPG